MVVGTYEGLIHVFNWHKFKSSTSSVLQTHESDTLLAHYKRVYSVACMTGGGITAEGITTFCPTFVGRSTKNVSRDFLISVGYGKYPFVANTRGRSFSVHAGVYLCVWMI